jgi:hypothetical protein
MSRYVLALTLAVQPLRPQIAEPILTKAAIPLGAGTGGIKLDYAGGIAQREGSQVIPEATLEAGIRNRLEVLVRFPLLRVETRGSTIIGGGQLAAGARYLAAGGPARRYALSLQTIVEAPTGDKRLVGNATQVMPGVLAEWRPVNRIVAYSNLMFDRSLGGVHSKASFLEYSNAVEWRTRRHIVPVLELVGSTDTLRARTQLIAQPEAILRAGTHLEGKAGLQLGLNSDTPALGLRVQLAWFWGPRR